MPLTGTPKTHYARAADGAQLAYQVVDEGDATVDLFWSFSQLSDVEAIWVYPPIAAFLRELASSARVVVHDRRGMGRSGGQPADLERDVADLLTVMDAVDAQRPYLAAAGIGGAIYAALAKENPERVAGLIWHGPFARSAWAPDYPWGGTPEELESYATKIAESWGTEPFAADFVAGGAPSRVGDVDATHFFAHWMRQTSDAWTAAEYNRRWDAIGLQPWLGEVRVPTLLTTRGIDPAEAAHVARLMPAATLVGLDGPDFMPFFDSGPFIHAVRDFMSRT